MKYLKIIVATLVTTFIFGSAMAQGAERNDAGVRHHHWHHRHHHWHHHRG